MRSGRLPSSDAPETTTVQPLRSRFCEERHQTDVSLPMPGRQDTFPVVQFKSIHVLGRQQIDSDFDSMKHGSKIPLL